MLPIRDENPTVRRPFVTVAIIVACAVVYFLVQPTPFSSTNADSVFDYRHATIPLELRQNRPVTLCQIAAGTEASAAAAQACQRPGADAPVFPGKPVRLSVLASLFLHGSIVHLLGNMLFLWIFGNNVEDRLGHVPYALFYVVGGIVATLTQVVFDLHSAVPLIGASGAIAAVMGAYLVWWPRARVRTLLFIGIVLWPRIPARWVLLGWFVLQFFTGPNSGVAWIAHVGGFVFGAVAAWVLRRSRPGAPQWSSIAAR